MKSRRSEISYADLQVRFHLPIKQSAVELGICTALLKKVCRSKGIRRWPHRKIRKIDKQIQLLLSLNPATAHERQKLELEIAALRLQRQQIIDNPNSPDSEPAESASQLDTPESDQLSPAPLSSQIKSFDSQELLVAQQLSMLQQTPISHRPTSVSHSTTVKSVKTQAPSSTMVAYSTYHYQQHPQQIYHQPVQSQWTPPPQMQQQQQQQQNFPTISSLFETETSTQTTGKRQLISLPPINMSQYAQPNPYSQPPPPLCGAPHGKPLSLPPLRIPELQFDQPVSSKLSVLEPSV